MTKGKKTTGLERVYNFIVKFITKNCYSPSIMEICEGAGIGVMGRGKPPIGLMKEPAKKIITKQDRKDLKALADDFGLLYRQEVQEIIETCKSYAEGQQKIMRVYTAVYLK